MSAYLSFAFGAGLYVSSPTYPLPCVLLSAASSLLETSSHTSFKTGSVLPGHLVPWAWTGACVLTLMVGFFLTCRAHYVNWVEFSQPGVAFLTVLLKFGVCYLDVQESGIKCHLNISTKLLLYFTLMG